MWRYTRSTIFVFIQGLETTTILDSKSKSDLISLPRWLVFLPFLLFQVCTFWLIEGGGIFTQLWDEVNQLGCSILLFHKLLSYWSSSRVLLVKHILQFSFLQPFQRPTCILNSSSKSEQYVSSNNCVSTKKGKIEKGQPAAETRN